MSATVWIIQLQKCCADTRHLWRRTRESWGTEGIGVNEWLCAWMSEWMSRWKYRPSHWIFYFLQYERWDSPLCSLLLSLFQVLKSTSWKWMKIFLFSKFILFHWSLLLLYYIKWEIQSCTTVIASLLYFILLLLFFSFHKYELHTFVLHCQQATIVGTVWDFSFCLVFLTNAEVP